MKQFAKCSISLVVVLTLVFAMFLTSVSAASTGYTKASDVVYKKSGSYIYNWGARDEVCVFLSTKAQSFYTGNNTYDKLSQNKGGTSQSNAPSSALYSKLKSFMTSKHSKINSYGEARYWFQYTDCELSNTAKISSFYSGTLLNSTWGSSPSWNREHTWPNSKGLEGSDEDDIMMLRPTATSENSSRGNDAYGESSGYYEPDDWVKGDCARIALYVYCRWGNTSKMWGKSGVIESLDILLKWMEEDPVDTWEMGRNDSVQAITGTRNVFVDYPEFAWLLFGRTVPTNMTTPSGENKDTDNQGGDNSQGGSNQGGNNSQGGGNQDNNDNTSSSTQGGSQDNNNNDNNNNNNTNSNGGSDRVDEDDRPTQSGNNTSSEDNAQGGIDKKPQNEGKPFDPNNLGGQYIQVDGDDGGMDTWVLVAIIAGSVVAVAAIAVVTVIVIKKKKAK